MTDFISKLNEKAQKLKERNFFHAGATQEEIEQFEQKLKITLPPVLKTFYANFNGGCFADDSWSKEDLENSEMKEGIIWNSNYFLSLQEMIKAYQYEGDFISFDIQELEKGTGKRFIPILHTKEQEVLVWEASNPNETPIKDAYHDINPNKWKVLYPSFESLINAYIHEDGEIETV